MLLLLVVEKDLTVKKTATVDEGDLYYDTTANITKTNGSCMGGCSETSGSQSLLVDYCFYNNYFIIYVLWQTNSICIKRRYYDRTKWFW